MSRWRDELTARIAAVTDEGWDRAEVVDPPMEFPPGVRCVVRYRGRVRIKRFDVDLDVVIPRALMRGLRGRVNDRECCGAAPGTLLILGWSTTWRETRDVSLPTVKAIMTLALRDRPWNEFLTADGWMVRRDAKGHLAYPEVDFGLIDLEDGKAETWHDRPSLL